MKKIGLYVALGIIGLAVVIGVGVMTTVIIVGRLTPQESRGTATVDLADGKSKTLVLKEFTTNLADTDRPRYIKVTFELVFKDDADSTQVGKNMPLVRDAVVRILNKKKSQEVTGEVGANSLKSEVLEQINTVMGGKYVQQVLITDFVVQY